MESPTPYHVPNPAYAKPGSAAPVVIEIKGAQNAYINVYAAEVSYADDPPAGASLTVEMTNAAGVYEVVKKTYITKSGPAPLWQGIQSGVGRSLKFTLSAGSGLSYLNLIDVKISVR